MPLSAQLYIKNGSPMQDKVKISYAIGLEEVPNTSQALLQEAVGWLQWTLGALENINLSTDNIETITSQIEGVRRSLARVDQRVDDCYAITAGYHDAFIASRTAQPPDPVTAVDQSSNLEMEQLTEQLMQLQGHLKPKEGGTEDDEE